MVDESGAKEQNAHPQDIREFEIGLSDKVTVQQKGRISWLTHPELGTTYLIDITDREDPARKDSDDVSLKNETLGQVFKEDLENPDYDDRFSSNNGVIAVITDKLDFKGRKRVYVGVCIFNAVNLQSGEITTRLLRSTGFSPDSFYVPFSFNSGLVKEYMAQEINSAIGSGNEHLFPDFRSVTTLVSTTTA